MATENDAISIQTRRRPRKHKFASSLQRGRNTLSRHRSSAPLVHETGQPSLPVLIIRRGGRALAFWIAAAVAPAVGEEGARLEVRRVVGDSGPGLVIPAAAPMAPIEGICRSNGLPSRSTYEGEWDTVWSRARVPLGRKGFVGDRGGEAVVWGACCWLCLCRASSLPIAALLRSSSFCFRSFAQP